MYLSSQERKDILKKYGLENLSEIGHHQVGPDVWVYLFKNSENKYALIVADYMDYYYDHFPHLLRFDNGELYGMDLVLQEELESKEPTETGNCALFRYTD